MRIPDLLQGIRLLSTSLSATVAHRSVFREMLLHYFSACKGLFTFSVASHLPSVHPHRLTLPASADGNHTVHTDPALAFPQLLVLQFQSSAILLDR